MSATSDEIQIFYSIIRMLSIILGKIRIHNLEKGGVWSREIMGERNEELASFFFSIHSLSLFLFLFYFSLYLIFFFKKYKQGTLIWQII